MARQYPIPAYRRHRATGQAIVTLSGKMFYLGPYGTRVSRDAYDRLVLEWIAAGRARPPGEPEPAALTVATLLRDYWKFAKDYYRKDGRPTGEQYPLLQVVKLTARLFGSLPCTDFGPRRLKVLRQAMIERSWSRSVINRQVQRVVRIFRWGAAEELLPAAVYQNLQAVRGLPQGRSAARETAPITPVDDAVVERTLPHLPPIVADMVRLQRLTGARPAEICNLRPADLDRSADVWVYRPATHKTAHRGKSRAIPLGPQAQAILQSYLDRAAGEYCFSPRVSERLRRERLHAFRRTPAHHGNRPGTNRRPRPQRTPGERYDVAAYRRAIARGCRKAFPPPADTRRDPAALAAWKERHYWAPNRLRHARATEVRRQFGLEAAQVVLGHAHANVTEIYAEKNLQAAMDIARRSG